MENVFDREGNEFITPVSYYPGEFLQEEVQERELDKCDFACEVKIDAWSFK